ncbi:MAG TPA: (Fe-S)-binding protein, partial [Candidatus Eisenbacteria bacterium]|nr:(Fe-S)-binding protein [Candidatus Eisenbacteria bacterium]
EYDWIVTSCASGGLMLKSEMKRLFDISNDGYFRIEWDEEIETFRRRPGASDVAKEFPRIADIYNEYVEGRVYDVNELVAMLLGLEEESRGFELLFGGPEGEAESSAGPGAPAGGSPNTPSREDRRPAAAHLPVVTYHHPCHLNRGQEVSWQPEALLDLLPGHAYVRMEHADRCCGGGGMFTFLHDEAAEKIAKVKMDAVEALRPDVLATSCPICRIQLMDMLNRRFVIAREREGKSPRVIPVKTPAELVIADLAPVVHLARRTGRGGKPMREQAGTRRKRDVPRP